jgi:hypothetical protein
MIIYRKVPRGKPGTKKLIEQYGDKLVCVRYRYDTDSKWMTKTVELLIEDRPWEPDPKRIPLNKTVAIHLGFREIELRKLVLSVGGKWDMENKRWFLPYREVLALGLKNRLISD